MDFLSTAHTIHFIVMSSVFDTEKPIHIKYDLKGSTVGRVSGGIYIHELYMSYIYGICKSLHVYEFTIYLYICELYMHVVYISIFAMLTRSNLFLSYTIPLVYTPPPV